MLCISPCCARVAASLANNIQFVLLCSVPHVLHKKHLVIGDYKFLHDKSLDFYNLFSDETMGEKNVSNTALTKKPCHK